MQATQIATHLSPWELFLHADAIVRAIILILLVASAASWGVILDKLLKLRRLLRRSAYWLDLLSAAQALPALAQALGKVPQDPFARVYRAISDEWHETHRQQLHVSDAERDSLKERLNRVAHIASGMEIETLQRGLSVLATVGSVAPFVGLLGTVWGIMNAFQGIAATNNTSLAVVAPGIAEALFATALGLVAAIPAVVGYNRAGGDVNAYANRLQTLSAIVEVQLSRLLAAGGTLDDAGRAPESGTGTEVSRAPVRLAVQGA